MAVFAFLPGPGAQVLALWCDDEAEYDDLWARAEAGTLTMDGQAVASLHRDACDRDALFIRFGLAHPYLPPGPVICFEDVAVAARIGETGWMSFEGGLYRAEHTGGGRIILDRVYEAPPPPQYHGFMLQDPPTTAAPVDSEAATE